MDLLTNLDPVLVVDSGPTFFSYGYFFVMLIIHSEGSFTCWQDSEDQVSESI